MLKVTLLFAIGRPAGLGVLTAALDCPAVCGDTPGDDLGVLNSGVAGDLAGDALSFSTSLAGSCRPWSLRGVSCSGWSCFGWSCF